MPRLVVIVSTVGPGTAHGASEIAAEPPERDSRKREEAPWAKRYESVTLFVRMDPWMSASPN